MNFIPKRSMNSSIMSWGAGDPRTSFILCSLSSGTGGVFQRKYDMVPTVLSFVIPWSTIHFQKRLELYFSSTTALAPFMSAG